MLVNTVKSNLQKKHWQFGLKCPLLKDEQGMAMPLVMVALSMMAIFSAYLFLSSVEEVRISDNSESMAQARFAARAGIDHAREVLRDLKFNDILAGPDGIANTSETDARKISFRNPGTWAELRSMNLSYPSLSGSDDGVISTAASGGTPGTPIIPMTGIVFSAPNPYGSGTITTARYFVKVSDNNGDPKEIAAGADPANNPFFDGDQTIVVRSVGVAGNIQDRNGRHNSIATYEARFKKGSPFNDLGSPAIVIGSDIRANFSGNAFDIIGDRNAGPGIGTIDTDPNDGIDPAQRLRDATAGKGDITGNCTGASANNCIAPVSADRLADPGKKVLTDPAWLYDFVYHQVPAMADYKIDRPGETTTIDSTKIGSPGNPKITWINGNAVGTGSWRGAGLLVVTGNLELGGAIEWDGLVLVIGKGEFLTHGMNVGIKGGLIVAGIKLDAEGKPAFSTATADYQNEFDIRGHSVISTFDGSLANSGNGLIPLKQISFREITEGMDPANQ